MLHRLFLFTVLQKMDLFCSFCRKSSDLGKVVSLEGLEFNDRQGYPTLVTDVVNETLPEVEVNCGVFFTSTFFFGNINYSE